MVSLLAAGVAAGGDFMDDMLRRELDTELFPRQQQQQQLLVANLQVRGIPTKGLERKRERRDHVDAINIYTPSLGEARACANRDSLIDIHWFFRKRSRRCSTLPWINSQVLPVRSAVAGELTGGAILRSRHLATRPGHSRSMAIPL
jgi:hypothetical protein